VDLVTAQLEDYARRGVFRSFSSQTKADGNRAEFCFYWLWNLPFHMMLDSKRKVISFNHLLPNVPAGSELNNQIRAFIRSRCSNAQPEHRRVDRNKVAVRYSNLRGKVSITFVLVGNEYLYGIKKALNLVNEMFVSFLNVHFPEYTAQHFHKRDD
jgi:hypothetical protein